MRKNRMMRLASILLVCVLLTTSVISGTFAKYVSEGTATDTARVAKWGITVDVSGSLFGEDYNEKSTNASLSNMITASTSDSVHSSGAINYISNIVAPGTKSDKGITFGVSGTPEVKYSIGWSNMENNKDIWLKVGDYGVLVKTESVTADNYVGYYYKDGSAYKLATTSDTYDAGKTWYKLSDKTSVTERDYHPLMWTIKNNTGGEVSGSMEDMTGDSYLKLGFNSGIAGTAIDYSTTLTWEWLFQKGTGADQAKYNSWDTILGNLMAYNESSSNYVVVKTTDGYTTCNVLVDQTDYNLEVVFNATLTVAQVD